MKTETGDTAAAYQVGEVHITEEYGPVRILEVKRHGIDNNRILYTMCPIGHPNALIMVSEKTLDFLISERHT